MVMEINDIKKALYKQKPIAHFEFIRKGNAIYKTIIAEDDKEKTFRQVRFEIPVEDMGDADFFDQMEAKLLCRWVQC